MVFTVTKRYIWLPVNRKAPVIKLHLYAAEEKFSEIDIRWAEDDAEYYVPLDLKAYQGKEIKLLGLPSEEMFGLCRFSDEKPVNAYPYFPGFHFTPEYGWMNDPNGLVFKDGVWHLYHQWNPYGTDWGNMHWGHAVSHDLIHWEHQDMAMAPDETGTMFSGCAFIDKENAAGFGQDAMLFFYTAAGGANQWSKDVGARFTQRLAVSFDNGAALEKKGLLIDHIKGGNRDPKVFYHKESNAYVMVLFLDGYEFAVFRSKDLIHWEETQRFTADKMRECPDLMQLDIDNEPGEKKWVFWSADGYYMVGDFDGYEFTPLTDILTAYDTALPYAAQTYCGTEGRTISIAWLRTQNDRGNFRGMMSVPMEFSLLKEKDGYRLRMKPVRELFQEFKDVEETVDTVDLCKEPVLIEAKWEDGTEKVIQVGNQEICLKGNDPHAMILIDHGIIEYFTDEGLVYGALEAEEDVLNGRLRAEGAGLKVLRLSESILRLS